jgi:glucosamine--fructose-6-phosphate aminotransferase (isomerizing)
MCGIVACSGNNDIFKDVILGLKRLEYRGYDSAGVAFALEEKLEFKKFKGRVEVLEKNTASLVGISTAIGHTRWATHGVPSDVNAHPHGNEEVAIVHNGIIENYAKLKEDLTGKGYIFKSQTDTEVAMVQLFDLIKKGLSKLEALQKMLSILHGSFAIVVIFKDDNKIYGIKRSAPMVVGYGDGKNFIASDVYAIAGLAKDVSYIDDNEIVVASPEKITIYNSTRDVIQKEKAEIQVTPNDVEKGNYPHYMLKEIHEQAGAIRTNLLNHYDTSSGEIYFPHFTQELSRFKFVKIIACGTSYNASVIAKNWLQKYASVEVSTYIASEFRYQVSNFNLEDTLYIFISQSGETADTITALKYVMENKTKSSKTLAIVNVSQSQIAKISDFYIECFCGPEIGVAATKSFTVQLISLALLTLKIASDKSLISKEELEKILKEQIHFIPNKMENFLNDKPTLSKLDTLCEKIANEIKNGLKIIYIGRGGFYGICLEGALKTQELFYIPILSFPAGELKHGPIAILDKNTLVIAIANTDFLYDKMSSSLEEISAREAQIALISNSQHEKASYFVDTSILGDYHDISSPILYALPIHLISYKVSILLENDVDKPRGLAKSVTVE